VSLLVFLFQLVFTHFKCVTHYDTFSRLQRCHFVGSARFNIAYFYIVCYNDFTTQQFNIITNIKVCIFIFGKNAYFVFAYFNVCENCCVVATVSYAFFGA